MCDIWQTGTSWKMWLVSGSFNCFSWPTRMKTCETQKRKNSSRFTDLCLKSAYDDPFCLLWRTIYFKCASTIFDLCCPQTEMRSRTRCSYMACTFIRIVFTLCPVVFVFLQFDFLNVAPIWINDISWLKKNTSNWNMMRPCIQTQCDIKKLFTWWIQLIKSWWHSTCDIWFQPIDPHCWSLNWTDWISNSRNFNLHALFERAHRNSVFHVHGRIMLQVYWKHQRIDIKSD